MGCGLTHAGPQKRVIEQGWKANWGHHNLSFLGLNHTLRFSQTLAVQEMRVLPLLGIMAKS
jgi:hypothetical protein